MRLLVKTGFRCQFYGWSSGASADVCPNPTPGIRLVTLRFEWAQPNGTRGPILAPRTISNTGVTGREGPRSPTGASAGSLLAGKAEKRLHMCLLNLSHRWISLPMELSWCLWSPFGYPWFRKPSLPWQAWDNSLKRWPWKRWSIFCDFVPKGHSKFRRHMGSGTNSELFGFCGSFCGVFFQLAGFFAAFHQYASLSKERTAELFSRQHLFPRWDWPLTAVQKDSGEKILLCACAVLPLRKEKTHPTCCSNDFYQN